MKKTIKTIIEEGFERPCKTPEPYFNQVMYSKGEMIKQAIRERIRIADELEKKLELYEMNLISNGKTICLRKHEKERLIREVVVPGIKEDSNE